MTEWNNETAEWYAHKYGEYVTNRIAIDALPLQPNSTVVDVGCGAGAALRHASHRVTRGALIGIDPIPRMVEIARERLEGHSAKNRIEIREGCASSIPVGDESADFVLAFDSFDYWTDHSKGLAEVRRILRSGGRLAIVKDGGVPDGADLRRALLPALEKAGFTVDDERTLSDESVSLTLWMCSYRGSDVPGQ